MKNNIDKLWHHFLKYNDKTSKQKIAEYYYNTIVISISSNLAKKIKYRVSIEELASYGVIGLYRAIDKYDIKTGVKFETYAFSRIWGSMIDEIRKNDWIPRSVRMKQTLFDQSRNQIENQEGRRASHSEILDNAGISEEEFNKYSSKYVISPCVSLEKPISGQEYPEGDRDLFFVLEDKKISSVDSKMIRKEFIRKLLGKEFNKNERKIIFLYYYEQMTMKDISSLLKVSESRVSQMHQTILKKMRKKIKSNPEYFDNDLIGMIKDGKDANVFVKQQC